MEFKQERIEELKRKHGDIYLIEVHDEDKTYSGIVRKANRKDLSFVSMIKDDPIKMMETLMRNVWIEGDEELMDRDDLFLSVMPKLEELLKTKEAEIKKL